MIIFIYYLIQTTRRRIKAKTRRRARAMSRSMVTWVKVTLKRGMASNKVAEPHTWQLQTKLATILSYLKEKICQAPMQDFLFWRVQGLPKIHWLKFVWELLGRTSWCQRERLSGRLHTFVCCYLKFLIPNIPCRASLTMRLNFFLSIVCLLRRCCGGRSAVAGGEVIE